MNKNLPKVDLREDAFDKAIELWCYNIDEVNSLDDSYHGYRAKYRIRHCIKNGEEYLVAMGYKLNGLVKRFKYHKLEFDDYKQYIIRNAHEQEELFKLNTITGWQAYTYVNKLLSKYYSPEDIDNQLKLHTAEYNKNLRQVHVFFPNTPANIILKFKNTYKYDINGAHLDALCEIFPKAKDKLKTLYEKRKENDKFKKIPNYYVGMLASNGHRDTYNWIVQRTTKKLIKAIYSVMRPGYQLDLLYANTDGFIIQNPRAKLNCSTDLGDFKLEYQGDTYYYRDKNYMIFQNGDSKKGSCRLAVRNKINLKKGTVAHYDNIRNMVCNLNLEKGVYTYEV